MTPKVIVGIYCIVNKRTKRFYIGGSKDIDSRIGFHLGELIHNRHFCKDLQKDWNENPSSLCYGILEQGLKPIRNVLDRHEQFWLDLFVNHYNRTPFANTTQRLQWLWTDPIYRANSILERKSRRHSLQTLAKLSKASKGRTLSEETKRKISESRKGQPSAWKGKKHSLEARLKMSKARLGLKMTDEQRLKCRLRQLGKKPSQETRLKMVESAKAGWKKRRKK